MDILDRQFEKFMGGPTTAFADRDHVTIDRSGRIFFNQKVHAMMGRPQAVYLYFNRPKDMIVIEPTQARTAPNAFILKDGHHGARMIYANPFCKHFGIRPDTTLRFLSPETDNLGRLYLKLPETVAVPRPGHRKKRQNRERRL